MIDMKRPVTLDDLFGETETDKARREAEEARYDSPAEVAKREEKRKADFERGVRLGWWDADGNPLSQPEDNEDEEGDEDAQNDQTSRNC